VSVVVEGLPHGRRSKQRCKKPPKKTSRPRYLPVGEAVRILGIGPSALRLWERVGLISPARSSRGYRLFHPELLELLKRIKYLRDLKKPTLEIWSDELE
jgi:MerR HTH family regulatory protein